MVEAALDKMMMGAAAAAPEDNLLIDTGGGGDNLSAPAAIEANDEYEERSNYLGHGAVEADLTLSS